MIYVSLAAGEPPVELAAPIASRSAAARLEAGRRSGFEGVGRKPQADWSAAASGLATDMRALPPKVPISEERAKACERRRVAAYCAMAATSSPLDGSRAAEITSQIRDSA